MSFDDQSTPRWPPVENGLPAEKPNALVESQRDLLTALRHAVGEADEEWERHYWPVVLRYVRWVHLLPASREHHHHGAGGLWCHGLEVALAAANLYDRRVVGQNLPREERRRYRKGLRWAAVCGGLLHDCAKPLTDVEVTDDNGQTWNPIQGSLVAWLKTTGASRYRLRWRQGRDGRHLVGAAIMLPRILGVDAQIWLQSLCGQAVLLELVEAVMDDTRQGLLAEIIHEADRLSVAEDMGRRGSINEDHRITGVAAERHIVDAMQSLLREGHWRAGGKVCMAAPGGEVVLTWPRAGRDIGDWLAAHHIPGIVRSPEAIADVLLDTGKAIPRDEERYWRFHLPEGMSVTGLRLKTGLIDLGDAPIGGKWAEESPASDKTSTEASTETRPAEQTTATPSSVNASGLEPATTTEASETQEPSPEAIHEQIASCAVAKAIFEDLASGEKTLEILYTHKGTRYLRYPDSFKGYGMSPMQAAKDLVEAGIAEADGKRVAVETGDNTKGTRLTFTAPPLPREQAAEHIAQWISHQSAGVVDIRGIRYVDRGRALRWAELFGDPAAVLRQLLEKKLIKEGALKDNKPYIRLEERTGE